MIHFTPRQKEVALYIMIGSSNKDIAKSIGVKVVTVKLHMKDIMKKLCVDNRTQAAIKLHTTYDKAETNAQHEQLVDAAISLRIAQKNYMADRGNKTIGHGVAKAAEVLDAILKKERS